MPHTQIVGAVQHTAVGVAAAVDQVAITLGSSNAHGGTVEFLDQQRLRGFGAEVAQEHHQGVDAVGLSSRGSQGVLLILHGDGALVDSLAVGGHNVLATLVDKAMGKQSRDTAMMPSFTSGMFISVISFKSDLQCQYFHRPGRCTPCCASLESDGRTANCCAPRAVCPRRIYWK